MGRSDSLVQERLDERGAGRPSPAPSAPLPAVAQSRISGPAPGAPGTAAKLRAEGLSFSYGSERALEAISLDARRQLLLPVSDNYLCRRRVSERVLVAT